MAPALLSCSARSNVMSIGHILNPKDVPATRFSFTRLPPEITQEIAIYLSDKDLASFSLVEKETCHAVIPVDAGHWRVRFREQFDTRIKKCSAALVMDYKLRKRFLSPHIYFKRGYSPEQTSCLAVIRRLINESLGHVGGRASNNCQQLWRFMKKSNLLFDAFRWVNDCMDIEHQVDPLLMTIQVFFFTWNLSHSVDDTLTDAYPLALRQSMYHIKWSQDTALAVPEFPVVDRYGRINMGLLYHLTNFWRWHLTLNDGEDSGGLWQIWSELGYENQPLVGTRKLAQGNLWVCSSWKGAMFHPNGQRPRSFNWQGLSNDDVYTDGFYTGGDDPLDMHFQWNDDPALWPEKFEKVVHAFPTDFKDLADILDTEYPVGTVPKPSKKRGHPVESEKSTPRRSSTDTYQNSLYFRRTIKQGTDRLRRSRAQHKWTIPTVQFFGFCDKVCGDLALNIAGIIHPLPAQSGVPEWSRITMVSYETPQSGTADKGYLDADEQDLKIYMRYEGIICPGGSVMLGFYHMGDDYVDGSEDQFMKHGPFIFWNTHFKKLDEDSGDEDDGESSGSDGDHSASDSPDDIDASITDNNTSHNTTQTFDEIMTSNSIGVTSKEEEEEDDEKFWLAAVEALHADD